VTLSAEVDHRLSRHVSLSGSLLRRRGSHALVVDRVDGPSPAIVLSSRGRSVHREAEARVSVSGSDSVRATLTYTWADGGADGNAFLDLLGTKRAPVIQANQYAPEAGPDHRCVAEGAGVLRTRWQWFARLDLRSGMAYSAYDERQRPLGVPNTAGRLPATRRLDVALQRHTRLWKFSGWLGLGVDNVLNVWLPRDVQENAAAVDFGATYDALPRRYRLIVRLGGAPAVGR
jgi:hypothetical protein